MVPDMMDIGKMTKEMDMGGSSDKMAMFTKATGSMDRVKALAFLPTIRGTNTKVSGLRMLSMAKARKHFLQECMKVNLNMAKKKDLVN